MSRIADLIELVLRLPSSSTVSNFYLEDSDTSNVFATDAGTRLANLEHHLADTQDSELVLVGEAAGWRGARQSGVAFTHAEMVGAEGTRELSAMVIHSTLQRHGLQGKVLLWNTLPLHPHQPGNLMSNRTPSRQEVMSARQALELAVRGRRVICVGQTASRAIERTLGVAVPRVADASSHDNVVGVRHPSYGGAAEFRDQFGLVVQLFGY